MLATCKRPQRRRRAFGSRGGGGGCASEFVCSCSWRCVEPARHSPRTCPRRPAHPRLPPATALNHACQAQYLTPSCPIRPQADHSLLHCPSLPAPPVRRLLLLFRPDFRSGHGRLHPERLRPALHDSSISVFQVNDIAVCCDPHGCVFPTPESHLTPSGRVSIPHPSARVDGSTPILPSSWIPEPGLKT